VFNDVAHQRFDHAILSFSLPAEEFSKKLQPARRQLAPTDRIDAVFFQNHLRAWQDAVQDKMLPASEENDGDTLMAMQRKDQEVMKNEVLKLQLKESKPGDEPRNASLGVAWSRMPSGISTASFQPPM